MRPRFSLRLLLVVVTIAAVGFGIGRRLFIDRLVAARECETIKVGMTAWEVRWRLGGPHSAGNYGCPTWVYRIHDMQDYFYIRFDEQSLNVKSFERLTQIEEDLETYIRTHQ